MKLQRRQILYGQTEAAVEAIKLLEHTEKAYKRIQCPPDRDGW